MSYKQSRAYRDSAGGKNCQSREESRRTTGTN